MNRYATIALAMLAGAVLGGAATQVLHAQAKPVFQVTLQDVSNLEALNKEFVPPARPLIIKDGGKLLGASAPIALDGTPPAKRVIINQWESVAKAKAWYNSAEYQKARAIGNKYAKFTIFLVEASPQ